MRSDIRHFAHKYQAFTRKGRASPECGSRGDNRRITVEIEYRADVGFQLRAAVKQVADCRRGYGVQQTGPDLFQCDTLGKYISERRGVDTGDKKTGRH